ncbi:MAG TPA: phosphohistidine phosphatase SixA [Myxococcales bacterium]|nr:phosphohistidine phosphatase SixA [Myxococcales bacterium]
MAHSLRHRLGHPVETTLELFGGKWKSGLLEDLKERLLQHEEIRKVIWRWSGEARVEPPPSPKSARISEIELQIHLNEGGEGARPSPEAGHVMQLYVVGHGIAAEGGEGISDEWRPLTDKGRRRFQKTARAFGKLGRKLDLILTSPLVRAVQTAEILARETEPGEVAVLAELDPKFDVEAVRNAIASRAGKAGAVAIVGHEPQLSSVLAAISGVSQAEIDLENGIIVRVDVSTLTDGASADPRWWLKPKGTRKKGLPLRKQEGEPRAAGGSTKAKRTAKKNRRLNDRPSESSSPSESPVTDGEPTSSTPR